MGMFSDWLKRDRPKGIEAARRRIFEDEEMIARELPEIIKKRRAGKNASTAGRAKLRKQGIEISGGGDETTVAHPPNWKGGDQLTDAGIKTTQKPKRKLTGPKDEDGTPFNPDTTPLKLNLSTPPTSQPEKPQPKPIISAAERIASGQQGPAQTRDLGDYDQATDAFDSFLGRFGQGARGSALLKGVKEARQKLENPELRNQLLDYLAYTQEEESRIKRDWDDLSQIDDIQDLRQFIEEGWQYKNNGLGYNYGDLTLPQMMYWGQHLNNANKGYRGMQLSDLVRFLDPEVAERMMTASREEIQSSSLVNPDLDWDMITKGYRELLGGDAQRSLIESGGPAAMGKSFDPKEPVYWLKDGSGNPTGLTNIDQYAGTDLYDTHFESGPGDARGIWNLFKLASIGGQDQLNLKPNFLDGRFGVVDHLEGRSAPGGSHAKDSPLNTGFTSSPNNWAKADSPAFDENGEQVKVTAANGVEKPLKDTREGLVQRAQRFTNTSEMSLKGAQLKEYLGVESGEQLDPSNEKHMEAIKHMWLLNRLEGKDFQRAIDGAKDATQVTAPRSVSEVADYEETSNKSGGVIADLVDKANMNIRGMGVYYPRFNHDADNYSENSWSGSLSPTGSHQRDYEHRLDGFRKPLIAGAYFGKSLQKILQTKREDLERGKDLEDPAVAAGIDEKAQTFFQQLITMNIGMPLRGAASSFTTGLASGEDFIQQMYSMSDRLMADLPDGDDGAIERMMEARTNSLDSYRDRMKETGMLDGIPKVSDEWLEKHFKSNPITNMAFSKYGRERLPGFVLDKVDEAIKEGKVKVPFGKKKTLFTGTNRDKEYLFDYDAGKLAELNLKNKEDMI